MNEKPVNDHMEIARRLQELHVLRGFRLRREIADAEIHFGQLPILEAVRRGEGCTQNEIAERLGVSPASVAVSTTRLQKAGLLDKAPDEDNLRRNRLSLTEKGLDVMQRCRMAFDAVDAEMFAGFTPDELASLRAYLERLIANIGSDGSNGLEIIMRKHMEKRLNK